jgi:hypothetical protein
VAATAVTSCCRGIPRSLAGVRAAGARLCLRSPCVVLVLCTRGTARAEEEVEEEGAGAALERDRLEPFTMKDSWMSPKVTTFFSACACCLAWASSSSSWRRRSGWIAVSAICHELTLCEAEERIGGVCGPSVWCCSPVAGEEEEEEEVPALDGGDRNVSVEMGVDGPFVLVPSPDIRSTELACVLARLLGEGVTSLPSSACTPLPE